MSGLRTHHDAEGPRPDGRPTSTAKAAVLAEAIPALRRAQPPTSPASVLEPPTARLPHRLRRLPRRRDRRALSCGSPSLGIPVEAVPAMTFATSVVAARAGRLARRRASPSRARCLVSSRAVRAAAARGLATVTITANAGSPLAHEPADATWVIDFEKLGRDPGHHVAPPRHAAAFYELGCAFATDAPERDRPARWSSTASADLVREAIAAVREPVARQARRRDGARTSLPRCSATVRCSRARGSPCGSSSSSRSSFALWQETEEYAHDEYSLVDERLPRDVSSRPPDRGSTRSIEIARYLRRLGVHLSVVTDAARRPTRTRASRT